MEKHKWTLVNSENIKPFQGDDAYQSRMLLGDEIAGMPVINVNEGTLRAGCRTGGGVHEETEIYCVVDCAPFVSSIWLDEEEVPVKKGDIIVIPPHVFHWIDNTKSDVPFVLYTLWPRQEQNEMYHLRKNDWGTSIGDIDPEYTPKRLSNRQNPEVK